MAVINKYTQEGKLLLIYFYWLSQAILDTSIYLRIWFNNAASQSISTQTLFGLEDNSAIWFPPNYSFRFLQRYSKTVERRHI